jgi:RluA family pseudouridine synthase
LKPSPSKPSAARKFRAAAVDAGQPLGAWIGARLAIGDEAGAELCRRGAVYVDGRRVRDPALALTARARLTVHPPSETPVGYRVVHEDPAVLVIEKPAGVPSQATRQAGGALDEQVAADYPGAVPLHRLDREASGLVLFARTPEARARLQPVVSSGAMHRDYAALVEGVPTDDSFSIDSPIGADPADHRKRKAGVPGGEPARTRATVTRRFPEANATLLHVTLGTGRTHQIRVHLASVGYPILGDPLYAPPGSRARAPRLCLHAVRLAWPGGQAESPLPDEFLAPVQRP